MFPDPVLLIIFNRPSITAKVFSELKKIKPSKLFVAADGPRPNNLEDKEKCDAARKIIVEGIDWECDVQYLFSDVNHGCGKGPFLAIDWFFSKVEEGIVLEDDCLPDQSFFPYCQELLAKYRDNEKIMMISGDNFQNGRKRGDYSYYFSRYNHTWGWASWRRAWKYYDFEIKDFPSFEKIGSIKSIWSDKTVQNYWLNIFRDAYDRNEKDFWDHQWTFAIWNQGGLACLPNVNLISNIGYGSEATHTFFRNKSALNIKIQPILFPLKHPENFAADIKADEYENREVFKIKLLRIWFVAFLKKTGIFGLIKNFYFKLIRNNV